jgi:positive regulator of sigma E activity
VLLIKAITFIKYQNKNTLMEKGTIHGVDKKRVYIRTTHKTTCRSCHAKHLCLGSKEKHRIIPATKKSHHKDLKKGDKVLFQINPRQSILTTTVIYGIPIVSILLGLLIGLIITDNETGILLLTVLFIALGIHIQYMIKKRYNIFRELDVDIKKDNSAGRNRSKKKKSRKKK